MDRKVIRTYKDYIEQGSDSFDFDTWIDIMTENYGGVKDEVFDEKIGDINNILYSASYASAKEKLSKSRLFDGASKFSVIAPVERSMIGFADAQQKANELLGVTDAPFSTYYPYLNNNDYNNIIFNEPFEGEGLTIAVDMGLKFLLTKAGKSTNDNRGTLFRALLVLNIFITLNNYWEWQRNLRFNLRDWKSSEKGMTERAVEVLDTNYRILGVTEQSTGLTNLKTILAAYDFLPYAVTDPIITEYLESGICPSSETTAELINSLSDLVIPNLLNVKMPKVTGLNLGDLLYPTKLGLAHTLPFPKVLLKSLEKKISHIPNAKGQLKMAVKGLNNFLYNPKLVTLMMKELSKGAEVNNLWNIDLGTVIIEHLCQGYRETLGKAAWKDISQEHFTYEHINNTNKDVEIIFSLEKEDIWTASSAGNSWTSCHAGCYGHSPMFLGGDEITFVVYEKGREMADEGVDSKRWRAYCHLWYDKNDKTKMAFSVEHTYPNKNKQISLIIKDVILDGLECVYSDSDTLFNHETINVLRGTTSHGYYDYNERTMDNYYTFDVLKVDEEHSEYFWTRGCEVLGYYEDEVISETLDEGELCEEIYNSIINLGFLIDYCSKSEIDLKIPYEPTLQSISPLGETFTAASRAIYTLMNKDDDISFGHGVHLNNFEDDEDLGGLYSTNYLSEIIDCYYSSFPQSIEWYY